MAEPVRSLPTQGLNEAANDVDARRRALVEAIAAEGMAGRQRVQQTQAALDAQRVASIQAAMAEAAKRGAPAGALGAIHGTINAPTDRANADLGGLADRRARSDASLSAAGDRYMAQASAAVPALREIAGRERSRTEAQMTDAANQRELERELAQMRLEAAREEMAFDREKMDFEREQMKNPLYGKSDAEVNDYLLGAATNYKEHQAAEADRYRGEVSKARNPGPGSVRLIDEANYAEADSKIPTEVLARQLAEEMGMDPNEATGRFPEEKKKEEKKKKLSDFQIMATPYYRNIEKQLRDAVAAAEETENPAVALRAVRDEIINKYANKYPESVRILLKEYDAILSGEA